MEPMNQRWYRFDPRPADVNELCAECGKSGDWCRGMIAIARIMLPPAGTAGCCGQCRHTWGMVHERTGATAPPFDSPEAVLMMEEMTALIERDVQREVRLCIEGHYRDWQARKAQEAADTEKEEGSNGSTAL